MFSMSMKSTKRQTSDFHVDHKKHETLNKRLSS